VLLELRLKGNESDAKDETAEAELFFAKISAASLILAKLKGDLTTFKKIKNYYIRSYKRKYKWKLTDPGVKVGSSSTDLRVCVPFQGFPGSNSGTKSVCHPSEPIFPAAFAFISSFIPPPFPGPEGLWSVGQPSPPRDPTEVDQVLQKEKKHLIFSNTK
jgi:hypothetical protein